MNADDTTTKVGAHPRKCTHGFESFLHAVDLGRVAEDDIRAVWDDAVAAPEWEGPRMWVHGDLHPANVVVADGTLAGIVDFGDRLLPDAGRLRGSAVHPYRRRHPRRAS
nr:phosphotransferase [Pseudofrankia inefficax]